MWKGKEKAPIWEFVFWTYVLWLASGTISYLLDSYSVLMMETGKLTWQYIIYAFVGICFSTPGPMIALYIVLKRHRNIEGVKDFLKRIFTTEHKMRAVAVGMIFCICALTVALIYGKPNGSPWYLLLVSLPVMIIGGGVEEIGWRGFLQPAFEKKYPLPLAALMTAAIWIPWHADVFILPSGGHYGDSIIGFIIWLIVWSLVAAMIYRVTDCVFTCVMYHAFLNSIGAVYDWNEQFDAFPNHVGMYIYFAVILLLAGFLYIKFGRERI